MIRTKADIEFHAEHYRPARPAINVKVYHYPDVWQVMDTFDCGEELAQQALNYAFEAAQRDFWEDRVPAYVDMCLKEHFGNVQAYSEGRSGGWLVVDGLGYRSDIEDSWDAIDLAKWRSFEATICREVKWMCSWEYVKSDIEANRWAEQGAELYNYIDFKDGHTECLVDMKQEGKACPNCAHILS